MLSRAAIAVSVVCGAFERLFHVEPPSVDRRSAEVAAIHPVLVPAKLIAFSALVTGTVTFDHSGGFERIVTVNEMLSPAIPTSDMSRLPSVPDVR